MSKARPEHGYVSKDKKYKRQPAAYHAKAPRLDERDLRDIMAILQTFSDAHQAHP